MATEIGAVAVAECQKNGADAALMVPMPPRDADRRNLGESERERERVRERGRE